MSTCFQDPRQWEFQILFLLKKKGGRRTFLAILFLGFNNDLATRVHICKLPKIGII